MNNNDMGQGDATLRPTELNTLIRLAEGMVRLKLPFGVSLNSLPGADECYVMSDQKQLGQVMMNLLGNACKYTAKGAITFGYEVYDDEIYFYVQDTGTGLTPEQKGRMADLFDNDDSFSPGLGTGLPIANAIVKKLGGNMGVESRGPGRGSKFWFTIPNVPASAADIPAAAQAPATGVVETAPIAPAPGVATPVSQQPAEPQPTAAAPDARLTILVAEDNASNFLLFQSILKRKYEVVHATDGLEAVELFRQVNPDLILMDINMPNMDGYEAVREIRKLSQTVPIIAVTAYAFVTDRQRILENGFNGYVSKPINMGRLDHEINNCLKNKL